LAKVTSVPFNSMQASCLPPCYVRFRTHKERRSKDLPGWRLKTTGRPTSKCAPCITVSNGLDDGKARFLKACRGHGSTTTEPHHSTHTSLLLLQWWPAHQQNSTLDPCYTGGGWLKWHSNTSFFIIILLQLGMGVRIHSATQECRSLLQ
jgi:hypothetical protein